MENAHVCMHGVSIMCLASHIGTIRLHMMPNANAVVIAVIDCLQSNSKKLQLPRHSHSLHLAFLVLPGTPFIFVVHRVRTFVVQHVIEPQYHVKFHAVSQNL